MSKCALSRPLSGSMAFTLGLLAALAAPTPASADVSISQVPLFVSTSVQPNVMLQFDNSGSMANLIWHADYDRNVDYPDSDDEYRMLSDGSGQNYWCHDNRYSACIGLPTPLGDATRYADNYLDWLVQEYGPGTNLVDGQIPGQTRLQIAKQVAREIVAENDNVNFGLTRFNAPFYYRCGNNWCRNGGEGGTVVAGCGSDRDDILDSIDGLGPDTNTPLAETYYEITRYFRGLSRHYGGGRGDYDSPVAYECQKNFVITITDGLPTYDNLDVDSGNDPDLPGPDGRGLPDYDGLAPETDGQPYPEHSDGEGGNISEEGSTLYLDDLAKFGYELDLGDGGDSDEFEQQRLETYTVGFTIDNQMLQDAADYGNGEYFTANNLDELTAALQGALSSIADKTSTAASLAASSTEAAGDTLVFQATFSSGDWSGELTAYPYAGVGDADQAEWTATAGIPAPAERDIFTVDGDGAGTGFTWSNVQGDVASEALLDYIRGDRDDEGTQSGDFRVRGSVLGDIVHSTPAFVGDQSNGYSVLDGAAGDAYRGYVLGKADEPDVVLVGANDGMLHAFAAQDGTGAGAPAGGDELFAYVPRTLFPALPDLASRDYKHRYYVDGSPAVADAYFGGGWKTVAVTTLGAGGPAAFALDVSDPDGFDAGDVLWEISPDTAVMKKGQGNVDAGAYLGTGMGMPAVVRTESGDWVAILGNGYNSESGKAALIVVELASGEVLRVLDTGVGGDNGLATPAAVDRDRDGSVDAVYAGDLKGNLWKFDLSAGGAKNWSVDYGGQPLFTAADAAGNRQPITARPDAMVSPHGGLMVVFGTGKYLSESDPTDTSTQSVYGIWDVEGATADDGSAVADTRVSGGRDDLVTQTVTRQTSIGGNAVRVLSENAVPYEGEDAKRGWVFDLSYSGERINRDVTVFDGKAILVSTIPNDDPCTFGGRSALIEINPLTGTQFDEPVLDLDDDGDFDDSDGVAREGGEEGYVYPGLVDLDVGLATNPNILIRPDGDHEKQITGSNLNTQAVGERGFYRPGRASWQQLR